MAKGEMLGERLATLPSNEGGLSSAEVTALRARFGPNDILPPARRAWLQILRDTAGDPMIWFLIGVASLYLGLGELPEAATLAVAIVPLLGMDAVLHWRTRASTEGLASRLATVATVYRDGVLGERPAVELVPGDLVRVDAGSPFPADGVVVGGEDLQADESALTGESFPVRKRPLPPVHGARAPCVADEHLAFAGTHLLTGRARVRVAFTGGETLYGEIARSALGGAHARTPLQVALGSLVSVLVGAALVVCAMLAVVRLVQGHGIVDAMLSAVTLAVAALPEEFPVVFTFFLGVGVHRLARAQALVRRAVSVENVGRVTCICSDKTGTITEGRLALAHLHAAAGLSESELLALAACTAPSDSFDPIDAAVRAEFERRGGAPLDAEVAAAFPFAEERRRSTVVLRPGGGGLLAVTKGAPEVVLDVSAGDDRDSWRVLADRLAGEGHKVIACASRTIEAAGWVGGEPDRGFHVAGLLAFEDPVRAGVAGAVAACRRAGIRTLMVTGDHPSTAIAVAREIGLSSGAPRVLVADEVGDGSDRFTARSLMGVDVIARAVPSQKLALVRALQADGEIVAVTGDGVNDVPALQAADVGIAIGERATRSARDVAAIVLLDDNFRTIVRAITEAQQLFRNLQKSFHYLLLIHIPLVVTAALIPLAGYPLLYLPIHIVWLELVMHPTALLVFQETAPAGDPEPPRREQQARFFDRRQWVAIVAGGVLLTAAVAVGFVRSVGVLHDVEHGRAMALATLTLASAALTAALSRLTTLTARMMTLGTVGLSLVLIQSRAAGLLHLRPLHPDDWALAAAVAVGAALTTSLARAPRRPAVVTRPP
jgi:Ca2+-transporting ATPase